MSKSKDYGKRICKNCNKEYTATSGNQKYCKQCQSLLKQPTGYKVKICLNCGQEFKPNSSRQKYCSDCKPIMDKNAVKKWNDTHKDYLKQYFKQNYDRKKDDIQYKKSLKDYNTKNKEKNKIYMKQYKQSHKDYFIDYMRNYNKRRCKVDLNFKISKWCRTQIRRCLNSKKKANTFNILDYTPEQLINHLQQHFKHDMNWDNYGKVWNIDHIKPLCSFNFIDDNGEVNYEEVRKANSLQNLIPLYVEENFQKSSWYNNINYRSYKGRIE